MTNHQLGLCARCHSAVPIHCLVTDSSAYGESVCMLCNTYLPLHVINTYGYTDERREHRKAIRRVWFELEN